MRWLLEDARDFLGCDGYACLRCGDAHGDKVDFWVEKTERSAIVECFFTWIFVIETVNGSIK